MKKNLFSIIALLFFVNFFGFSQQTTTIKVMTYNLLNFPNPSNSNTLGNDNARIGYFKEIIENTQADVILLQEITNISGITSLVNALNGSSILTGAGKFYNRATLLTIAPNSGGYGNMLIYNDNLLDLISQVDLPRNSVVVSGQTSETTPRPCTAYLLNVRPTGCSSEAIPIYFIGAHLKGSDTSTDENARLAGTNDIMNYINNTLANPSTRNVVVAGDLNMYRTTEKGYNLLLNGTASGTTLSYQNTFIDKLGAWTRNSSGSLSKFTQATSTTPNQFGNGNVDGGLDDRFDFILVNETINNNSQKVGYQNNSYQNIGTSGVPLNGDASQSNSTIKTQILRTSDHYPVTLNLTVTCPVVVTCAINAVSASNLRCEDLNFKFDVNFTPVVGSGSYQVVRTSDNVVLATTAASPVTITVPNNISNTPFQIVVRDANNISCTSSSVQVTPLNCFCQETLTINSNPISERTYRASSTINSAGFSESGTIVVFEAGTQINLLSGFTAEQGTEFTARIADCSEQQASDNLENRTSASIVEPTIPDIQIFPNPASETVQIIISTKTAREPLLVYIFNAQGKLVQSFKQTHDTQTTEHIFNWNCTDIPNGSYWLQVNGTTKPIWIIR